MALSEFDLIKKYFSELTSQRTDVVLGVGDDCALLKCPDDKLLAVSIDTLVEGVHFFKNVDPVALGHKALAVNLSDLAAMGATPAWFTLALTLPQAEDKWLADFTSGLSKLAAEHNIQLVGGDTTRGPLSITIQVHGFVDKQQVMRRDGAKPGDKIYVSGTLGDAGVIVRERLDGSQFEALDETDYAYLQQRLDYPTPRNQLSERIKNYASAAVDISDGLLADLMHLTSLSGCGAKVQLPDLPLPESVKKLARDEQVYLALTAGDDYELCFTVPAEHCAQVDALGEQVTCIGEIDALADEGVRLFTAINIEASITSNLGYQHFLLSDNPELS